VFAVERECAVDLAGLLVMSTSDEACRPPEEAVGVAVAAVEVVKCRRELRVADETATADVIDMSDEFTSSIALCIEPVVSMRK